MPHWLDPFLGPELATGLTWGLAAVLVGLLVGLTSWRPFTAPVGEVAAVGVLVALPVTSLVPGQVWLGVTALIVGGIFLRFREAWWMPPLIAVPGAWLIAGSIVGYEYDWVRWFAGIAIVLGGWAAASFSTQRATSRWSPAMFSVSALGVFLAVPDTEAALVLLGAFAPLFLLSLPLDITRLSAGGAYALVGTLVWVTTVGGVGRPASVIGAAACVGLLAADPIARRLTRSSSSPLDSLRSGWAALVVWSAAQLFVVLAISRTAGLLDSVTAASIATVFLLGTAVAAIAASQRGVAAE